MNAGDGLVVVTPVAHRHVPAQHTGGDHPGEVDRVLGAPERRRVAQLGLLEVVHRGAQLDRQGDVADPLVDAVLPTACAPSSRPSDVRKITFMAIGVAPG